MSTHSLQYSLIVHAIESTCANFDHYFFSCFRPDKVFFLFTSSQSFSPASTGTTKTVEFVDETQNWWEALEYCRRFHTDLASGTDQLNQTDGIHRWTGYFRDNWRWSNGSDSLFRKCESTVDEEVHCALLLQSGELKPEPCDKEKPFICYEGVCLH